MAEAADVRCASHAHYPALPHLFPDAQRRQPILRRSFTATVRDARFEFTSVDTHQRMTDGPVPVDVATSPLQPEGMTVELSEATRTTAAIVLFGLVSVETGGFYLVRLVRGSAPATPFQVSFARAGHAHAGVLLVLALVALVYADASDLGGVAGWLARFGVPLAALLIPGGFFFSSMGRDVTAPNRLIVMVYAGAVSLAAGLSALAIGLLQTM